MSEWKTNFRAVWMKWFSRMLRGGNYREKIYKITTIEKIVWTHLFMVTVIHTCSKRPCRHIRWRESLLTEVAFVNRGDICEWDGVTGVTVVSGMGWQGWYLWTGWGDICEQKWHAKGDICECNTQHLGSCIYSCPWSEWMDTTCIVSSSHIIVSHYLSTLQISASLRDSLPILI